MGSGLHCLALMSCGDSGKISYIMGAGAWWPRQQNQMAQNMASYA
jgi:hypothetical protein